MNMDNISFSCLNQRTIIALLIGDTCIEDKDNYKVQMPYLSGPDICNLSNQFGRYASYSWGGGSQSRWMYMQDLLEHVISNNTVSNFFSHLFDFKRFDGILKNVGNTDAIKKTHREIVKSVICEINAQLLFSEKELKFVNGKFVVNNIKEQPIIEAPTITLIDVQYIRDLPNRIKDDFDANNFDSVITKSRTLIEEVFIFILEKKSVQIQSKGDLFKLYQQVKKEFGMIQCSDFDKRVNGLLSGLEKIIQSIAEMRNANSDAHGVGSSRINIRKHEAQLVVNAAITFSEYILSLFKSKLN